MADLGLNAYRFSISWPRVIDQSTGQPRKAGLDFYDRLVDALLARGIEPFATLYHWDLPLALFHRGGWLNEDSPRWFADYTTVVAERLSDRVKNWMTFNEPQMFIGLGLVAGTHAPGLKMADREVLRAMHHVHLAHGRAVQALRANAKTTPTIGLAPMSFTKMPVDPSNPDDVELARSEMFAVTNTGHFNNTWYLDPILKGEYPADGWKLFGADVPEIRDGDMAVISEPVDFLGVNIYSGVRVRRTAEGAVEEVPLPPGYPCNLFGWPLEPEALYWGPRFLAERYGLPIYITENGITNPDFVSDDGAVHDPQRTHFLSIYLRALGRAIEDGADVRGYFHWSLLDNFEWAEGYKHRFGLVHVDFETGERTVKDSAAHYRQIIETNGACL